MPVRDLVAAGSNAYVAALFDRGHTADEVRERVQERFPTASARDVNSAVEYGHRAWSAAVTLDVGGEGDRLPAGAIPRAAGDGTGYSYTVRIHVSVPQEGGGAVDYGWRQFEVRSTRNLTRSEVARAAEEAARLQYSSSQQGSSDAPSDHNWDADATEILAVERY